MKYLAIPFAVVLLFMFGSNFIASVPEGFQGMAGKGILLLSGLLCLTYWLQTQDALYRALLPQGNDA